MRVFAVSIVGLLLALAVPAQDTKPKQASAKAKSATAKKAADNNPKRSSSAETSAKKRATAKIAKPKSGTAKVKSPTANPASNRPKTTPAAGKKPDEAAEYTRASEIAAGAARSSALKKFLTAFPASARRTEAMTAISTAEAALGSERIAASDLPAAAEHFRSSVTYAPTPIPDALFNDTLSKFAANLFFRGARSEGFEIARILEERSAASITQLLSIATFYMSVENGTEAGRVAEAAIRLDPASSAAYQTLGLANRIDFRLEDSANAYAKALDLEADSISARRGLAEMKRALGKPDEAISLYREMLSKDAASLPAQTGLILSLLDADKRTEAETELAKSLETNAGNVVLLASAAYWYATRNEGDKAVEFAQKAIAADPRFIWSHIGLARGHLVRRDPIAAEKTLLAARRYGNFPTLEYEIASAKMAAGLYREASEELAKSFSVKDGLVHAKLGGRVTRESKNFTELIGYERRASIFAPTAADSPENAARLTALLELKQELDASVPKAQTVSRIVDDFVRGDDQMKVHRQIFAASSLLDKKVALPKVAEIAAAAPASLDAGLDPSVAALAVMAAQLYESRAVAAARGDYVEVPSVPRPTLSAILRGEVEELGGWAAFQMEKPDEAVLKLKRAVSVLPVDSAWFRSSSWRLGTALAQTGKEAEGLEWYIKSYKTTPPNAFSYGMIETLYKKVTGSTDGLEAKIGRNPATPSETATALVTATPEATPEPKPVPSVAATRPAATPPNVPVATPMPAAVEPAQTLTPEPSPEPSPTIEPSTTPSATPMPVRSPPSTVTPAVATTSTPSTTPTPTSAEIRTASTPSRTSTPQPELPARPVSSSEIAETNVSSSKPSSDLFPAVIITVPKPTIEQPRLSAVEVKPCILTVSEETITLQKKGGNLAVIIGRTDDADLIDLRAISTSPDDVRVRQEVIAGMRSRALFVLNSLSQKTGVFQVKFELACGRKDITVRVR